MVERSRSGRGPSDGSIFSSEDLGLSPVAPIIQAYISEKRMRGWCSKKRNPKR